MSVYTDCGQAARMLLDDWTLRSATTQADGIFTDLDVIFLAARLAAERGEPYGEEEMRLAQREASQAMGVLWRNRLTVRYGPVKVPRRTDLVDYVRIVTKIVYASPNGPEMLHTPNGDFGRLWVYADPIPRTGRRGGSSRNDFEPWADQAPGKPRGLKPLTADQREVLRLQAELSAAHSKIEELEIALHSSRERTAVAVSRADLRAELESVIASHFGDEKSQRAA